LCETLLLMGTLFADVEGEETGSSTDTDSS
jgi:hypothetical protein